MLHDFVKILVSVAG